MVTGKILFMTDLFQMKMFPEKKKGGGDSVKFPAVLYVE